VTLLFHLLRRFGAKPDKKIVDCQAASPSSWKTPFIATVRASVVGFRRIDSVARTAAELIREASSSGDHQALGRFLRSFTGYLEVPGSAPRPTARDHRPHRDHFPGYHSALAVAAERRAEVAPFQWTVCQLAVYVLVMAACMSAS
jgi:hypothetical protein